MKKVLFLSGLFFIWLVGETQAQKAAKVCVSLTPENPSPGNSVLLTVKVEPSKGWHVYSSIPSEEGAYNASAIQFAENARGFSEVDSLSEAGEMITDYDEIMQGTIRYYDAPVVFTQKLELNDKKWLIAGTFLYMACDDGKCMMFYEDFELKP